MLRACVSCDSLFGRRGGRAAHATVSARISCVVTHLVLTKPVVIEGKTVIPKGARAEGVVVEANPETPLTFQLSKPATINVKS